MITLSRNQWFELSEALLDDSAGPLDVPWTHDWDETTDLVTLEFADPREQTVFLLRYSDLISV
jgi:hypothetical protein